MTTATPSRASRPAALPVAVLVMAAVISLNLASALLPASALAASTMQTACGSVNVRPGKPTCIESPKIARSA